MRIDGLFNTSTVFWDSWIKKNFMLYSAEDTKMDKTFHEISVYLEKWMSILNAIHKGMPF